MCRFAYLCYRVQGGDNAEKHLSANPLGASLMINFQFMDPTTLTLACLTFIFVIHIDYCFFIKSDWRMMKLAHELMIDNGVDLMALNARQLKQHSGSTEKHLKEWKHLSTFKQQMALMRIIWNSSKIKFKHPHLSTLPNLSTKLRARIFVYAQLLEWLFIRIIAFICELI